MNDSPVQGRPEVTVSVVIPTLNAGPQFATTLEAVRGQRGCGEVEIVVVDSQSQDETLARAQKAGARTRVILRSTFNHGATRNLGAALARGRYIAFLTQDALPAHPEWLQRLIESVEADKADAAYCRVLPRPGCSPLVERSVRADLVHSTAREVKRAEPGRIERMDPFERRVFFHFNNVASLVRRDLLQRVPFPEFSFGEDLAWAGRVLEEGNTIVYEPRSVVLHSHESHLGQDFSRHRADARLMRTLFGFRNRDGLRDAVPAWLRAVRQDRNFLLDRGLPPWRRLRWLGVSVVLRACQIAGQLMGSYDDIGPEPRFPHGLPPVERSR